MCLDGGGIESAWKYLMERERNVMTRQRCGSFKKKEGGLGGVAMCKRIFESKENDQSQNIHQLKFKTHTHTQKKEKSRNGSNMCWLWMKRLLCCSSHILYAHAKGGLQYRAAATDSLGRNIYATALCETQPQFFPRFLESADSWWVITAKV